MTGTPPFECGPDCPAPDHHGRGPRPVASDVPVIHTGNSTQAQMIEATAADVAVIAGHQGHVPGAGCPSTPPRPASGSRSRSRTTPRRVAGIDYRDLAAMGPESVMTEPEPCGYPGDLEPEAGT